MNTRITLKQLETLYWIVELGTFERAAARLFATQSAVSKRVQELYEVAKKMLLLHDQILEMSNTEDLQARSLKIGVTELVASTWFPQLATVTKERFPQVRLEPKVAMSRDLFNDLEQDKLDLIIIPETFTLPGFVTAQIASVQNHWVAQKGFFGAETPNKHHDLAQYTVLVQGQMSGSGLFLNKWLKNRGVVFPETLVCDSMSALLGLAVAGLGVTYLPDHFCRHLVEEGKLEIIETDVPLPPVPYVAIYREDRPHSLVQEVVDIAVSCSNFERKFTSILP